AIPKVCRTGTHILQMTDFVAKLRGFGRSVRNGINSWYTEKNESDLTFQLLKYQDRHGWKHSDVFRLTHPKFDNKIN
ncbi:TROVE domain-containing protein, partial [Staphylococcus aureus]|uniref:TROVE domain-containing protein n=1 Tax=Staphylococcus aureus TaxID=1280 RepID=UPI001E3D0641